MAFNPRSTPRKIISHHQWMMLNAQQEVYEANVKLKPLPPNKPLGKKVEYYMELWKYGTKATNIVSSTLNTANLKHVMKLILNTGKYTILYVKRTRDNKVVWDKR